MIDFLIQALKIAKIPFSTEQFLCQKTTFKIGGKATLFVIPETIEQFISILIAIKKSDEKFFVLGGGSNVVFSDKGFDGVVISTEKLNFIEFEENNDDFVYLKCFCGTPMATVVNFCTNHNLTGFEEFAGLPGSVGGAVFMNARCFEKSISDIFYSSEFIEENSKNIQNLEFSQNDWDYKKSPFQNLSNFENQKKRYILTATFKLKKIKFSQKNEIQEKCKFFINERKSKGHFKFPSAGSVFKNNRDFGKTSGKIIEEAGLKGTKIGGAQIPEFHANFIVNNGNATFNDVKQLVELTQKTVKLKFGFQLEPEIIFV